MRGNRFSIPSYSFFRTDEKQRYSFSEDKKRIRANQGHSVPVDVELEEAEPLILPAEPGCVRGNRFSIPSYSFFRYFAGTFFVSQTPFFER